MKAETRHAWRQVWPVLRFPVYVLYVMTYVLLSIGSQPPDVRERMSCEVLAGVGALPADTVCMPENPKKPQ